ncbi:MAG: response regulator transcription factor, partial [Alcanivorax sp.]|nr:response regulator transcription factor [Alcanivorax sp.]
QIWLSRSLRLAFPDIEVARADTLSAGLQLLATEAPDICLVDLRLPDGDGIDFIRACRQHHPHCKLVVTSIYGDEQHIFPALEAGAHGYLLKEEPQAAIAQALKGLKNNRAPLSASVANNLVTYFNDHRVKPHIIHRDEEIADLTERQKQILLAVARGMTTRDIADRLDISIHTASKHVKNIYAKLDIHNRAQATQLAIRTGLLSD